MKNIEFELNGSPMLVYSDPSQRVVDVLRNTLGLTGTKAGCAIGECGACTILLNGKTVNSCLLLIGLVEGQKVITVEGLASNGGLHPIQQKFLEHGAVQCGFCTPGMLLSAYALLEENPNPSEGEIKDAIAGNLCRCTGYKQIIDAIKACI